VKEEDGAARFQKTSKSALLPMKGWQSRFCVTQCGAVPEEARLPFSLRKKYPLLVPGESPQTCGKIL
jgi:hypothetical protein